MRGVKRAGERHDVGQATRRGWARLCGNARADLLFEQLARPCGQVALATQASSPCAPSAEIMLAGEQPAHA